MHLAKNVVEPLFIVAAFTVGTLINRRRRSIIDTNHRHVESSSPSPSSSPFLKPSAAVHIETVDPSPPFILVRLLTRFFDAFPFLVEIWYWNLTYWVYQLARAASARYIAGNQAIFDTARSHALSILSLESHLGIAVEQRFQHYLLTQHPQIMPFLASIYYSHITLGVCFIIYTYTFLPAATFQRIRRTIALDNAIAFVIVTLYRCSPPRLLPAEYGFIDVLHGGILAGQGNAWTHNRFQLTIAAMPSLHFGTALFFGVCMVRFSPHRWLRVVAMLWPAAMLFTIVATANHFLLDAAVGALVPLLGWRYNQAILVLKPIQDWMVSAITSPFSTRPILTRKYAESV